MDTPDTSAAPATPAPAPSRMPWWLAGTALALTLIALATAWNTQQRVKTLEQELVKRQSQSQGEAAEARVAARAAQDLAREAAAKTALLEARVAEAAMQRSQIEELLQSVARSRDENVLADLDAAVRVALQQSAITGSAEPLVATLKQADERLARYNQPRLERVRRAVQRDLERTRALGSVDVSTLAGRLDEAVRMVDELPLLAAARGRPGPAAAGTGATPVASPASAASGVAAWGAFATQGWQALREHVAQELRALVRVTRIDAPEAALIAPEQQFFVRENLKLRLLNARLALLSRQFDVAQSDLREADAALERYFDRSSRRVGAAGELLRQVAGQARQVVLPRPDDTLAALATAAAGR
ncbi:MAG TPA: uroporphyrinogen-III C-methyltransferase [Burkholderiaceae bacterium]|nr:uroporphyrinogen-III C-methyltransferase [Burkholderiaceae bacterium]